MRIALLGGVAVTHSSPEPHGDDLIALEGSRLGGRRAHIVIAALGLEPGPLTAERLASLLWDDPPETWRVAVRGLVADLRRRLAPFGDDLVVTTPTGYRLAAGVMTDVGELEASVAAAAGLRASGRWHELLARLEVAPRPDEDSLAGGLEAPWLRPHRDHLRETVLRAGLLTVHAHSELGDHDTAVAQARRLVAAHALDERANRALIRALDRAGDRAGAVQAFESCRAVLAEALGIDPSPETVAVYLAVLRGQLPSTPARLPTMASSFVGRGAELRRLAAACTRPGLVVVTGPGGVGKSRLTQEVVSRALVPPGGRFWVSLAAVAEDALVEATVAMALGLPVGGDEAGQAVASHLAPLGHTVLVLDGCEAVLDGAATLASLVVSEAPVATVVLTTRVPPALRDEVVVQVHPLPMPGSLDTGDLRANEQVRLVSDRVAELGGELVVDESLAPFLALLCHRCAGLPLALELVAAQLTAMSPADLVEHLDEMAAEAGDALRDVLQASHALLEPDEAAVFRRMSVLEGQVDLVAIRAVAVGDDVPRVRVVRLLRELTARGLVIAHRSGTRWSYELDDDLHRFARLRLEEAAETGAAFDRLADLVRSLLPDDPRSPPAPFSESVTALLPSLRGLLGAGVRGEAEPARCLELAFRLHRYWAATSVGEGRYWLGRLLEQSDTTESGGGEWTAYATYAAGYLSYWAGDDEPAVRHLERSIDLLAPFDASYVARAQIFLAGILDDLDRGNEAVALVQEAITHAAAHGQDLQVSATMGVGSVLAERGDPEASRYAETAIELCESHGSPEQLAASLPTAAMIAWQVGDLDRLRRWSEQAMPMHAGVRRIARVVLLSATSGLHLAEGDLDAAVDLGRQADGEGTELGVERELPLARSLLALALLARGDLSEAADRARAGVQAAVALGFWFPTATALETAALVAAARGVPDADLAGVMARATQIRRAGDRPVPAPIAATVAALRDRLPAVAPDPDAVDVALGW